MRCEFTHLFVNILLSLLRYFCFLFSLAWLSPPTYFSPSELVTVPWPFFFPFFHSPTFLNPFGKVNVHWQFGPPFFISPLYFGWTLPSPKVSHCIPLEVSYWYRTPVYWPITVKERRMTERMMSICFTKFPNCWLLRTQYITSFVLFYNVWGFYKECVLLWRISWGY